MPEITPAEEEIAYFQQIGTALAVWANIEWRLMDACLRCIPNDEQGQLTRNAFKMGFVNIQGARNKIMFAFAMVRRVLATANPSVIPEWDDLKDKVLGESTKRNHLAHYQSRPFPRASEGRRWALCPWSQPKGTDPDKPPPESYCLLDLVVMEKSFLATTAKLANFLARVCSEKAPFEESEELPGDPPDLRHIARLIHEALGHPQQSARQKRMAEDARNAAASMATPIPGTKKKE